MKKFKNIIAGAAFAAVMTVSLALQSITAFASTARIAFSDPSTEVGAEFSVTMKVTSTGGNALGKADIMLTYDSSALEFVSGTNAEGGAGSVRVKYSADTNDVTEFNNQIKFKALKAGKSDVKIETQEVYDVNSKIVTLDKEGKSTVTVAGEETKNESTTAAESETKAMTDTQTGETKESTEANEEKQPAIETTSKMIKVVPLEDDVEVPVGFEETSIEIDGQTVTGWVWASAEKKEYCVIYGENASGEKNFYRYDINEKTIQRYFIDPNADTGVTKEEYTKVATEYNSLLKDYNTVRSIMIASLIFNIFLIFLLIILSKMSKEKKVRQVRRNVEVNKQPKKPEKKIMEEPEIELEEMETFFEDEEEPEDDFEEIDM